MLYIIVCQRCIEIEGVGHYQKRVQTQLRNLQNKEKGLAGRCRLTNATINRL